MSQQHHDAAARRARDPQYQRMVSEESVILDITEALPTPGSTPARCSASSKAPHGYRCATSSASRASSA